MKILKQNQISEDLNKTLTEAEDSEVKDTEEVVVEEMPEAEPIEPVVDPANADISEISDTIEAAVEAQTEENANDPAVLAAAQEVKKTSGAVDADLYSPLANAESPINVKNALTDMLDDALADVQLYRGQGRTSLGSNCLVTGLPGSGKTAVVYEWARANNINILYLDSKNPDLETLINGFTLRDITAKDDNKVAQAFSTTLDPLDRPRSVLFLDELNRQTKPHIRASLLTLINERCITGKDGTGRRYFPNLLFTIACINPSVPTDKGAAELNDAEKSRFVNKLTFDSNSTAAFDYFTKKYDQLIKDLDTNAPTYAEWYKMYKLEQALALYIVSHPQFAFNTKEDLEALADEQKTILSQRSLTDGIAKSHGDANRFLRWVKNSSDFLQKDIDMIEEILSHYTPPTVIVPDKATTDKEEETSAEPVNTNKPEEESKVGSEVFGGEDDTELFSANSGLGNTVAKTPVAAEAAILAAVKKWGLN